MWIYVWKLFTCSWIIMCVLRIGMERFVWKCWKENFVLFPKEGCWFVVPGSCGNISDGSSRSSSYGTDDRTPPTVSRADFPQGTAVTHACLNLNLKPNGQLESSSSEDLPVGSSHSSPSPTLYAKPTNRNEARPPPPPYRHPRLMPSVVSSSSVVSQSQQHPQQLGKNGNQNSSSPAGTLTPTSPEWQDWQRDRWHIWQLLSSDNADTLPETLVWFHAKQLSVFIYRSHCLMCVMYRLVFGAKLHRYTLQAVGWSRVALWKPKQVQLFLQLRKIPGSKLQLSNWPCIWCGTNKKWSPPWNLLARFTWRPNDRTCHSGSEPFPHFLF